MDIKDKPEDTCTRKDLEGRCRKALDHLYRAADMPREPLEKEVHLAFLELIKLRDCLIKGIRGERTESGRSWCGLLPEINKAMSLMAGVRYPSSGIHRNYMEQARKTIEDVRQHL